MESVLFVVVEFLDLLYEFEEEAAGVCVFSDVAGSEAVDGHSSEASCFFEEYGVDSVACCGDGCGDSCCVGSDDEEPALYVFGCLGEAAFEVGCGGF